MLKRLNQSRCRLGHELRGLKKPFYWVGPGSPTGKGTFGGHTCPDLPAVDILNLFCMGVGASIGFIDSPLSSPLTLSLQA